MKNMETGMEMCVLDKASRIGLSKSCLLPLFFGLIFCGSMATQRLNGVEKCSTITSKGTAKSPFFYRKFRIMRD